MGYPLFQHHLSIPFLWKDEGRWVGCMNNEWDGRSLRGWTSRDETGSIGSQHVVAGAFESFPGKSCISADLGDLFLPVEGLIVL